MICANGLNKTKLISFPRCGHHLLVRGLQWALQGKLIYSNYYESEHNFETCEYVNLQKSHDFNLDESIQDDLHYIILIRGFELAVESWYKSIGSEMPFEDFRDSKLKYYDDFTEKYVANPPANSIVISYNDFVSDKVNTVLKAVKHLTNKELHPEKIMWIKKWEIAEQNKRIYEKTAGIY